MPDKTFTQENKSKDVIKKTVSPKVKKNVESQRGVGYQQILNLQRSLGNQAVGKLLKSGVIQTKLRVGAPNDKFEQEADQVANRVMSMTTPSVQRKVCGGEEEEKIQSKPIADTITPIVQREAIEEEELQPKSMLQKESIEEEEVQTKPFLQKEAIEEEKGIQTKRNTIVSNGMYPDLRKNINALEGNGKPLPESELQFFGSRLGVDFSKVRVHNDTNAGRTAQALQAKAFTRKNNIVFGEGQYKPGSIDGRRLLAHELTHVIQQKAVSNRSDHVIQRYTVYNKASQSGGLSLGWLHPGPDDINVADNGRFAVGESGADAWAEVALIKNAEATLKSIKSDIKLIKGTRSISGKEPNKGVGGTSKTLKEVKVINRSGGGRADLTADCATTARQVLGINSPSKKFSAVIKRNGVGTESYTKSEKYPVSYTPPEAWFENILRKEFGSGLSASAARARYDVLSSSKKDEFDRKYGINKYAKPKVGQAITVDRASGWNFHFAGVILRSGDDYATTENFPAIGRTSQSWYFEIYGPKSKGQTFYDEWKRSSGGSTAMVVESDKVRTGKTSRKTNLVQDFPKGTQVKVIKKENTWIKVNVLSGWLKGKRGWIRPDGLSAGVLKSLKGQKTKTIKRTNLVLTSLTKGTNVFVIKRSKSWRRVKITLGKFKGWIGWINNKHYQFR